MKITKNFSVKEFICKDGNTLAIPAVYMKNVVRLAENLQVLRDHIDRPIYVNSGYRTIKYNKAVGGSAMSQHLCGKAADIRVKGMSSREVYSAIKILISIDEMEEGGLGLYKGFVHYDIRGIKARW